MSVRQSLTTIRFPGKLFFSSSNPKTVPRTVEINVETTDILKVVKIIPMVSELKLNMLKNVKVKSVSCRLR